MAAPALAAEVVANQQKYATTQDVGTLFEALTVSVLSTKPANVLAHLATELGRFAAAGKVELPAVSGARARARGGGGLRGADKTVQPRAAWRPRWRTAESSSALHAALALYTRCAPLTHPHTHAHPRAPIPCPAPQTQRGIDTEEGAAAYLESAGVTALLEELMTAVLVAKPAAPAAFLAAECSKRAEAAAAGLPKAAFFTDDDLKGIHTLFDATHNNLITAEQARTALRTLGVPAAHIAAALPAESASLNAAAFVALARAALDRKL
jgi:hypothetical protein